MLNKVKEFLKSYENDRCVPINFLDLVNEEQYNIYLTKDILKPVNDINSINSNFKDNKSVCTALSRIEVDKSLYQDILKNRDCHNIFIDKASMDNDDPKEEIWFIIDNEKEIIGPISSNKMNDLFKSGKISSETLIKQKLDSIFYKFIKLLKIYTKYFINKLLNEKKLNLKKLVIKGNLSIKPPKNVNMEYYKKHKNARFSTLSSKPKKKTDKRHLSCFNKNTLNSLKKIDEFDDGIEFIEICDN